MKLTEHDMQKSVIAEADLRANVDPRWALLLAIPNAGKRNIVAGKRMKAEGLRKGVPDLLLPVASGQWHGLFLELKIKPNKPSAEQNAWMRELEKQGYLCEVIYDDPAQVIWFIEQYMEGVL